MPLTVTKNNDTKEWHAEITEAELMEVIVAGLPVVFPGQIIPTTDMQEAKDGRAVRDGETSLIAGRGTKVLTIVIIDEEPA